LRLKLFTFRFSNSAKGFDDQPLQEFIADKEVIEFSEHFFMHEKIPYLTVLLAYRLITDDERRKRIRRVDPRMDLDDQEKAVYDALRTWRATRARQEGIPPYMIANNKQLAKMIKLGATTKSALAKVDGIGDVKIVKYGDEILQTIAQHPKPETETIDVPEMDKDSEP
jgi:ATP-dependent DNA helicase RecQ